MGCARVSNNNGGPQSKTYESAIFTEQILTERKIKQVLLVTSAAHMPRALATFRSNGVDAMPSPTDYLMVNRSQPTALDWIPNLVAVGWTTSAIREHLGIWVYQYKGWIKTGATNQD